MLMGRRFAGVLILMLFIICALPTVAHGYSNVRTNVKPELAFSQSVDVQIPGLVGNVWPTKYVLAGSVGDVIFALSASGPICPPLPSHCLGWDTLAILVPPEFGNIVPEQVASTLTNNYANIIVRTLSVEDRYGPGWTIVSVTVDGNTHHQFINFTT